MSIRHFARSSRVLVGLAVLAAVVVAAPLTAFAGETDPDGKFWNFMPSRETGAQDFRNTHPRFDGRGVVVAILDTGVDAFAPGLLQTTTGLTKLIDVRDFSTEGDWDTTLAEWVDAGRISVETTQGGALLCRVPVGSYEVTLGAAEPRRVDVRVGAIAPSGI